MMTSQTYQGNGLTGFGGVLGNGSISVTSNQTSATDGSLTFTFNPSGGFTGNTVVVYIDSVAGGIANTSNLSDTGDNGRRAISGEQPGGNTNIDNGKASRTQVNFASGFGADYAIAFDNTGFNNAFSLPTNTSALTFVATQKANTGTGNADSTTVSYAQLGLTPGGSFNFVSTLIDGSSAYRSNETVGTSNTTVGAFGSNGNAGYTGTQTFSSSNTFMTAGPVSAAPEPDSIASALMGALVIGGCIVARRRTVAAKP